MMPPGNPPDDTNIAVPVARFKELADWLTSEAEDRRVRVAAIVLVVVAAGAPRSRHPLDGRRFARRNGRRC